MLQSPMMFLSQGSFCVWIIQGQMYHSYNLVAFKEHHQWVGKWASSHFCCLTTTVFVNWLLDSFWLMHKHGCKTLPFFCIIGNLLGTNCFCCLLLHLFDLFCLLPCPCFCLNFYSDMSAITCVRIHPAFFGDSTYSNFNGFCQKMLLTNLLYFVGRKQESFVENIIWNRTYHEVSWSAVVGWAYDNHFIGPCSGDFEGGYL